MKTIIRYPRKFLLFVLLMSFLQACGISTFVTPTQDSSNNLSPFLLQPEDIDIGFNWRRVVTSSDLETPPNPAIVSRAYIIFDGGKANRSVYFAHTLACHKKEPVLEPVPKSNRIELTLNILEFGDQTLSFCYQSHSQVRGCDVESRYSNLTSTLTVYTTPDASDDKQLEEWVNMALTVIDKRIEGVSPCK